MSAVVAIEKHDCGDEPYTSNREQEPHEVRPPPRLIRETPCVRHEGSLRSVARGVDKPDEDPRAYATKLNGEHAHGQVVSWGDTDPDEEDQRQGHAEAEGRVVGGLGNPDQPCDTQTPDYQARSHEIRAPLASQAVVNKAYQQNGDQGAEWKHRARSRSLAG